MAPVYDGFFNDDWNDVSLPSFCDDNLRLNLGSKRVDRSKYRLEDDSDDDDNGIYSEKYRQFEDGDVIFGDDDSDNDVEGDCCDYDDDKDDENEDGGGDEDEDEDDDDDDDKDDDVDDDDDDDGNNDGKNDVSDEELNNILLSALKKKLNISGGECDLINSIYDLICGKDPTIDYENVEIPKNVEKRIESFFNDLKKQSYMWSDDNVYNEDSIEEIIKMNDHLDPKVVRQLTSKRQSVFPIIDVIIHVIRWAKKAKRHYARDAIQLINILRLQLYQSLNKEKEIDLIDVISMKALSLRKNGRSKFGISFRFETVFNKKKKKKKKNDEDEKKETNNNNNEDEEEKDTESDADRHVFYVNTVIGVWHAVYSYLSVTKHRNFGRMKKVVKKTDGNEHHSVVVKYNKDCDPYVGDPSVMYLTKKVAFRRLWSTVRHVYYAASLVHILFSRRYRSLHKDRKMFKKNLVKNHTISVIIALRMIAACETRKEFIVGLLHLVIDFGPSGHLSSDSSAAIDFMNAPDHYFQRLCKEDLFDHRQFIEDLIVWGRGVGYNLHAVDVFNTNKNANLNKQARERNLNKISLAVVFELFSFVEYKSLGMDLEEIYPRSSGSKRPVERNKPVTEVQEQEMTGFFEKQDLSNVPTLREQIDDGVKSREKLISDNVRLNDTYVDDDNNEIDFYVGAGSHDDRWSRDTGTSICSCGELEESGIATSLIVNADGTKVQLNSSEVDYYSGFSFHRYFHERTNDLSMNNKIQGSTLVYPSDVPEMICPLRNPVLSFSRSCGKIFKDCFDNIRVDVVVVLRCILKFGLRDCNRDNVRNQTGRIQISAVSAQNQGGRSADNILNGEYDEEVVPDVAEVLKTDHNKPKVMIFENKFYKDLKRKDVNWKLILTMIGQIVGGIYGAMVRIRKAMKELPDLAPSEERYLMAGQYITRLLHAGCNRGEAVTGVATCLSLKGHRCKGHRDKLNCPLKCYCDHGMLNICVRDSYSKIWLLQFGVYFRAFVGNFMLPYKKELKEVLKNMNMYLDHLKSAYKKVVKELSYPEDWGENTFDKGSMFFNDVLPWKAIQISFKGETKLKSDQRKRLRLLMEKVSCLDTFDKESLLNVKENVQVLAIMISPSRIFDSSTMIHQIIKLSKYVKFDQLLEFIFIATMQNSPVRFYSVTEFLLMYYYDESCSETVSCKHPFYLYQEVALKVFRSLQGGPHHRYRPFGVEMSEIFGLSVLEEKGVGKLRKLISILMDVINWIDSLKGSDEESLSIDNIRKKTKHFRDILKDEVNCELAEFRLQVFYGLAMASGCVQSGPHLEYLFYPVEGGRSFKHFKENEQEDFTVEEAMAFLDNEESLESNDIDVHSVSEERAEEEGCDEQEPCNKIRRIDEEDNLEPTGSISVKYFDIAIEIMGQELRFLVKSRRMMEGMGCESRPNRCLKLKSLFVKGCNLYELFNGVAMYRKYGDILSDWCEVVFIRREFEYYELQVRSE